MCPTKPTRQLIVHFGRLSVTFYFIIIIFLKYFYLRLSLDSFFFFFFFFFFSEIELKHLNKVTIHGIHQIAPPYTRNSRTYIFVLFCIYFWENYTLPS
jgi:hypothetical protein